MPVVVEYSKRKKDINLINKTISTYVAKSYEQNWDINVFYSVKDFAEYVGEKDFVDFVCVDVCESIAIPMTEIVRKKNKNALILILADTSISPAVYMKPSIMAAALLLFPLEEKQVTDTINELFRYFKLSRTDDGDDYFVIKTKSQLEHIPNSKIMYFESKEKKLFLNTSKKEYGFYDTIDNISEKLPDYFIRCHRSFVINSKKIKRVMLSQNLVELDEGIMIPLSKSYKPVLKEYKANAH